MRNVGAMSSGAVGAISNATTLESAAAVISTVKGGSVAVGCVG